MTMELLFKESKLQLDKKIEPLFMIGDLVTHSGLKNKYDPPQIEFIAGLITDIRHINKGIPDDKTKIGSCNNFYYKILRHDDVEAWYVVEELTLISRKF